MKKNEIKYLISLKNVKNKKANQQFVIEGENCIEYLLNHCPSKLVKLFINRQYSNKYFELSKLVDNSKIIYENSTFFDRVSQLKTSSQLLALVDFADTKPPPDILNDWSILLENIQDPGNFGNIIRTAHWLGVKTIFAVGDCPDRHNNKAILASAGSILDASLHYTSLDKIKQKYPDMPIIITSSMGTDYAEHPLWNKQKGILCFGNEGKGISEDLEHLSNYNICIKKNTNSVLDSLNVGSSVAIILSYLSLHKL